MKYILYVKYLIILFLFYLIFLKSRNIYYNNFIILYFLIKIKNLNQ